jgi:hypothetical protein
MANQDYEAQLTAIYNSLLDVQASLGKLALASAVNTIQEDLQTQLNSIAGRLDTLTVTVQSLQLVVNDLLTELRSK